jgi:exonuclease VII small subunit
MEDERPYIVRTLYMANYGEAAAKVAQERHSPKDMESLRDALKKLEAADKTLEAELNAYAERGYELVTTIKHELAAYPADLMVTAIFKR